MVNRFSQYRQLYVNYTKITDKLPTDEDSLIDQDTVEKAKTFVIAYNTMIQDNFPIFIQFNSGKYNSYLHIFDNFTVPFVLDKNNFLGQIIYMSFNGSFW